MFHNEGKSLGGCKGKSETERVIHIYIYISTENQLDAQMGKEIGTCVNKSCNDFS